MRAFVCDAEGVGIIGTFLRTETREVEGRDPIHQVVVGHPRYDGSTFERSIMFDDFDRDTGAQTQVSAELAAIPEGARVFVPVKYQASRSGSGAWCKAQAGVSILHEVDLADDPAPAANGNGRTRSKS